ncbi:4Fe-4S dicluster domain-containing protein [Thalassomonas actiniarum]|uniref:4Fe-4S dicluster domain-containing protein n=1 Tax=Thalassomonas actiniarum TaxID=485447 RepID=A0AAE9YN89_9GAMM|nr:4Fe-4S dicluster domain-containing protein [Thalassomonas actiniarum]WDD96587.1 4Fe-4S dicluster domain-containing protein [Thalassomonas actiniarum]
MQSYLLDDVQTLQRHLAKSFTFYQVVKSPQQQCYWQQLDDSAHDGKLPPLISEQPLSSAKGYFFAEHEKVLAFNGTEFRETLPTPPPFVLFGVQSCDLSAIYYQDIFFKADPYYQARRKQALLVGLDCTSPCRHGFCPTVDAGPGVRSHTADLTLHPLDNNRYLLIENTAKGLRALAGLDLPLAGEQDQEQRQQNLQQCEQGFADARHISLGIAKINDHSIADKVWQEMAIQCIGCSGCTSLCPTCSCYGTREKKEKNGDLSQERFWDSCLYEGFQREASFHNPSTEPGKRVQRFWQHKFSNAYLDEFQRYGCVGCGRCEQTCPGIIGVHSVMKRIVNHG